MPHQAIKYWLFWFGRLTPKSKKWELNWQFNKLQNSCSSSSVKVIYIWIKLSFDKNCQQEAQLSMFYVMWNQDQRSLKVTGNCKKKGKGSWICIAPHCEKLAYEALRHGSHSLQLHHTSLYLVKHSPDGATTNHSRSLEIVLKNTEDTSSY